MKASSTTTLILTGLAFAACTQEQAAVTQTTNSLLGEDRIATVNDEPVPESLLRMFSLNALQRDPSTLSDQERQRLVDQLVLLYVVAGEAENNGLAQDPDLAAELEYQRLQVLARSVTEKFRSENPPTEAELRQAYEANLPSYASTEYKARHILVETEAEAADLIEQLDNGADFAQLAQEHSTGPTGPNGGDLGWFSATSMVAPFAEAVQNATIGQHTAAPVQTRFGWHVILVEDSREQQAPGLESVRDELTTNVERQKMDAYVNSLREAAQITLN